MLCLNSEFVHPKLPPSIEDSDICWHISDCMKALLEDQR